MHGGDFAPKRAEVQVTNNNMILQALAAKNGFSISVLLIAPFL